ncbi:NADPH:quinone oxidoreductase family protein [Sedimentimonas flavescens]|uniref:NADPH:quinone oxidoreductase family protein n=1 Tax=Sedimentimonas flavescens TaxID=2851012 RepID=UPI001C49F3D4|nr:NADPH:quinone oxidoreductase family protein [Sedimentimonas flavescens]MBW0157476.1 NADPH:quinone oxidoreductase family protein [Sedimentimonas flavescens]
MRAYQLTTIGSTPALVDLPLPAPGPGEVQVRIAACGLNFADLLMTEGKYQDTPEAPFVMGMELAGTVVAAGPGTSTPVGTRVAVFSGQGGLAEAGNFAEARCTPLPDAMGFDEAAAFQIAYGTSHVALGPRGRLAAGETLVVLGAAGGVGLTAVEIGKRMGARVIACARGADKLEVARKAGADVLIDSETPDLKAALKAAGGADVVYDAIGGEAGEAAFGALKPGGRYLVIGFAGGSQPKLRLNHALVKNLEIHGLYWGGYLKTDPAVLTGSMRTLFGWFAEGGLRPHISARLPLERTAEALEMLRSRRSTGKVVVTME